MRYYHLCMDCYKQSYIENPVLTKTYECFSCKSKNLQLLTDTTSKDERCWTCGCLRWLFKSI